MPLLRSPVTGMLAGTALLLLGNGLQSVLGAFWGLAPLVVARDGASIAAIAWFMSAAAIHAGLAGFALASRRNRRPPRPATLSPCPAVTALAPLGRAA